MIAYSTTVLKPNSCRAIRISSGDKPTQPLMILMTEARLDVSPGSVKLNVSIVNAARFASWAESPFATTISPFSIYEKNLSTSLSAGDISKA